MSPKDPTGMHISQAGFSEGSPFFFLQVVAFVFYSTPVPGVEYYKNRAVPFKERTF